ncbi:MAG: glycogen debranching protein, partial [Solirubrobacteraceae bacterium]
YGTIWPVVSQQLGVRPFLGQSALQVVPQVPEGQPSVSGSNIRLGMGHGSIDVFASHAGSRYTTTLALHRLRLHSVQIGQTLPAGSTPASVRLDGRRARGVQVRVTNRGVEVTAPVTGSGPHRLVVRAA